MTVCTECGRPVQGGDCCPGCGPSLSWHSEPLVVPPPLMPVGEPSAEPAAVGVIERVESAAGADDGAGGAGALDHDAPAVATQERRSSGEEPTAPLVIPALTDERPPKAPAHPPVSSELPAPQPFPLAVASETPPPEPSIPPARHGAGDDDAGRDRRPDGLSPPARKPARRVVLALILSAAAVGLAFPSLRGASTAKASDAWTSVRRLVAPSFHPVRPVHVRATSSAPDHDASRAWDRAPDTYWSEGAEGDGIGHVLTFVFDGAVDVHRIVVTPAPADAFSRQPRPRDLHIVLDDDRSLDVTLRDVPEPQAFAVENGHGVTRIAVTISGVYRSPHGSDTSIAEVEFFRRA